MLKSYQRRAIIAIMVLAIEPASSAIARAEEPENLWETLNKVERTSGKNGNLPGVDPDEPQRIPLGPVPGFTVPSMDRIAVEPKSKKKVYRGPLGPINKAWDALLHATGSSVDMRGDGSISFQANSISGGSQATTSYQTANYVGQGSNGVYTNANLNIDATMFKYFHYSTVINNSPYRAPNQNRVKLDYNTKQTRFQVGDINVSFVGNSLIDFSRYLSGIELDQQWTPQFKTKMLYSVTKAETKTISTTGNNTSGPYYLFSGQIVDGSAHLRIDNRDMQQGKDYTLDPNTGELNFLNGIVVLQSQTIALTYEAQGYNQNQGTIWGIRTQYTPKGANSLGFTYVTQQTPRTVQFTQRKQEFQGQEIALASYTLDLPIDTKKPFSVTVGGVPLVQGTATTGDFFIDPSFPNIIRLRNPVSSLVNVIVTYIPLDTSQNPGSRSVLGIDSHLGLGRWGSMTLEAAMSGLSLTSQSYTGKAATLRLDLTPTRNLSTHFTVRNIDAAYSPVQSPGFNRSEKSIELAGDYNPFKRLHLNFEALYAKRPSYSYSSTSTTNTTSVNTVGNDSYKQYNLGASYDLAKETKINFSRSNNSTDYVLGGSSSSSNDNLDLTWNHKQLAVSLGIIHNLSTTNSPNGYLAGGTVTGTAYTANSDTTTQHASLQWRALKWLDINTSISQNAIHNTGSAYTNTLSNTTATSEQITFNITPPLGKRLAKWGKNIRLSYSFAVSDSGNNSTSTTTTGTGTGTGIGGGGVTTRSVFNPFATSLAPVSRDSTNSFGTSGIGATSGGSNYNIGSAGNYSGYLGNSYNNVGLTSLGGRTTTNRIGFTYLMSNTLNLNLSYDVANSSGTYQYNTNRKGTNANLSWTPNDRYQLNAGLNLLQVNYTGGQGATKTNTLQFSFNGRPFGRKLQTSLIYQSTLTNSTLNLSNTSTSVLNGTSTPTSLSTGGNGNSNLSQIAARVEYPISMRHSLFVDWSSSMTSGYLANSENDLRFGMDLYLTQFLKFTMGWQSINRVNKDTSLANYNYHTSTLLAEFGLHF